MALSTFNKIHNCNGFIISYHCQKMIDIRDISLDDIIATVEYGEIITAYNDDKPYQVN